MFTDNFPVLGKLNSPYYWDGVYGFKIIDISADFEEGNAVLLYLKGLEYGNQLVIELSIFAKTINDKDNAKRFLEKLKIDWTNKQIPFENSMRKLIGKEIIVHIEDNDLKDIILTHDNISKLKRIK
jgi:hypothetical protein